MKIGVVGAGPSGLTIAYELLKSGHEVTLIERDQRVGGLSKSYRYGDHIFDTGPKRFHTDDEKVLDFINEVMEMNTIGRSTLVYFLGKFFHWPLKSSEFFKLPPLTALQAAADLLKKREIVDPRSFQEYIIHKYGPTLYGIFFKPYTEKFLRWSAEDIHADWASTGINRSIIDKRVKANSLQDLIGSIILPQKIETNFLYPAREGFGGFFDCLNQLCRGFSGFRLLLGQKIMALEEAPGKLHVQTSSGESHSFDELIWSGNVNDLARLISPVDHPLHYLNTIFYNLVCPENAVDRNRAQWIYISDGKTLLSRITCMKEMGSYTCPEGFYNFICEVTDCQSKPIYFREPRSHLDQVLQELGRISFLRDPRKVANVHIEPVVDTYPIYHKRYHRDFAAITRLVRNFSKKIRLLGRSGAFWYNNSDHSIRMALDMAEKINGEGEELDYRSYFGGGKHEEVRH